ncbi:MAG: hypothetical protein FJ083_06890 [Cyanobacteria bacterium K_Offshore_surface_m2_239]|nr:hypothetical protein [Cyanobacteria bacterium K_Offshore_surface_m2_239]
MLTPDDEDLLRATVLPALDRHHLSLLLHGLRTFQAIAARADAPPDLPDRSSLEAWVADQPALAGDPGFQEAFVEQLCRLRDPLRTIAARVGVPPLDLGGDALLAWVRERVDARLSPLAASPPREASSPPPG